MMWQTRTTGQTRWLEHELALKYSKPHQASNKQRALISDRCTRIQFSYKIRLIILVPSGREPTTKFSGKTALVETSSLAINAPPEHQHIIQVPACGSF
jgi:hypothetical protein